jgi:hypothetical protein
MVIDCVEDTYVSLSTVMLYDSLYVPTSVRFPSEDV